MTTHNVTARPERDPDYLDRLINENEAASFIGYTVRALQNWRVRGGGPKFIKVSARSIRYGAADPARVRECTAERATLLGCNRLLNEQGHIYELPLPPGLSGTTVWRRLTITLAWLSPPNFSHRSYRAAALWFDPPGEELRVKRMHAD